jgi:hypothetical protein
MLYAYIVFIVILSDFLRQPIFFPDSNLDFPPFYHTHSRPGKLLPDYPINPPFTTQPLKVIHRLKPSTHPSALYYLFLNLPGLDTFSDTGL